MILTECPDCGYDGNGRMKESQYKHQPHVKQLNPENPNKWICGNCSCAFN